MLEQVLRAIAALIVIAGLLVWLAKAATGDGAVSRFLRRLDRSPALTRGRPHRGRRGSTGRWSGLLQRTSTPRDEPLVTVRAREPLMGRSSLAVVDVDGHRLVLTMTDSQVSLIREYPLVQPGSGSEPEAESADPPAPSEDFGDIIDRLVGAEGGGRQ